MASISHGKNEDKTLPSTLQELLQETVINNSFRNKDVTDQLISTMESAYAYLYRYQQETAPFVQFHYQTREFLLKTTYGDIQNNLRKYYDELAKLEKAEEPDEAEIKRVQRLIAEQGEVRFGDLYLNKERKMTIEVPFNMIEASVRETYRRNPLYGKAVPLTGIDANDKLFYRIPIVILDHKVRADIMVTPIEKGTRISLLESKAADLYNTKDSQKFHDIQILFVENIFFARESITGTNLRDVKNSENMIPFTAVTFQQKLVNTTKNREGIFFCSIEDSLQNRTHLMECAISENGITFENDADVLAMIGKEPKEIILNLWFCDDMYRHTFYTNNGDVSSFRLADSNTETGFRPDSGFFIPMDKDKPHKMPIPEDKFFILKKCKLTEADDSPVEYRNIYGLGITMYYPNFYQVTDPDMDYDNSYRIYYSYRKEPGMQYTPLYEFYSEYLQVHYNYKFALEEILNMVYFRLPGYDNNFYMIENYDADPTGSPGVVEGQALSQFYAIFNKILEYKDYDYMYGTPDFMADYSGDDIPLQYKIAKMWQYVKHDYRVLMDYVNREQDKTHLLHFFVNTVELRDRFRRSTRLENEHKKVSFAEGYEQSPPGRQGSLQVVDNNDYDPKTEIHIEDVRLLFPTVALGSYVTPIAATDRYVFGFKNPNPKNILPIKIYVDGLLVVNYEIVNVFGMDYIYIPTSMIEDDSYIMIEFDKQMENAQKIEVEFPDDITPISCHFINTPGLTYTMNDIVVRDEFGDIIDRDDYDLFLTRDNIDYKMTDERNHIYNEFGEITDIKIVMIHGPYPRKATVVLNKISFIKSVVTNRRGYCKFDIKSLGINPDSRLTRIYFNGRLVSPMFYKTIKQSGREYIQTRIYCRKGDEFLFEYSPYAKTPIITIEEFDQNNPFDFSKYLDKPVDPRYYEFFVNGRRLGISNIFEFGPHHGVFRGLYSKYLLEIYEKERDIEYFGYDMLKIHEGMGNYDITYNYYFEPIQLIHSKFMTKEEKEKLIELFIEQVKDPNAVIRPNYDLENPVEYTIANEVLADLQTFYFEEVIPLSLADPNNLQFLQEFITEIYPCTVDVYEKEYGDTKVVYLDPNVAVHIHDPKTLVDCEEDRVECTKYESCKFSARDYTPISERVDGVKTFFNETIYEHFAEMRYEGVTRNTYDSNLKVQGILTELYEDLDTLIKQAEGFRDTESWNCYFEIHSTSFRCDQKLFNLMVSLNEIRIPVTDKLDEVYYYFQEIVEILNPEFLFDDTTDHARAAHRCVNENYPYVELGDGVYDVISVEDVDIPNSTVMLLGEEDYTEILLRENKLKAPAPDQFATQFTTEMYSIKNIYIQGVR